MADYNSLCRQFEEQLGVKLKQSFFDNIWVSIQGERTMGQSAQQQLHAMFAIFLESDMNAVGAGCLPPNIQVGPAAIIMCHISRRSAHRSTSCRTAFIKFFMPLEMCVWQLLPLLQEWHKRVLEGRFVAQIDEVVNITASIKQRSAELYRL
jgi:hypothetical protein